MTRFDSLLLCCPQPLNPICTGFIVRTGTCKLWFSCFSLCHNHPAASFPDDNENKRLNQRWEKEKGPRDAAGWCTRFFIQTKVQKGGTWSGKQRNGIKKNVPCLINITMKQHQTMSERQETPGQRIQEERFARIKMNDQKISLTGWAMTNRNSRAPLSCNNTLSMISRSASRRHFSKMSK